MTGDIDKPAPDRSREAGNMQLSFRVHEIIQIAQRQKGPGAAEGRCHRAVRFADTEVKLRSTQKATLRS